MSSAEHNLLDIYDRISSSKIVDRNTAINDLRQVLSNRRAPPLGDKGWHKMYEVLFKAVANERTAYIKATKQSSKKLYADRLSNAGYCLRLAVEAGVPKIKLKTVKAIYNHILDTLPTRDKSLLQPLSLDYLKTLSACLGYSSHTEHLIAEEWQTIADFCRFHLTQQLGLDDLPDESSESTPRRRAMVMRDDSNMSMRSASGNVGPSRLSFESEELLECLHHLLVAGNAPVLPHAKDMTEVLLGFLRVQTSFTRAHQTVFASLNCIISAVGTNKIDLTNKIAATVIPTIARLWDTKLPGLKEEMIIFLIQCGPQIRSDITKASGKGLRRTIEDLQDILFSEYIARADRETLQLDDVTFPCPVKSNLLQRSVLSLNAISLRSTFQDQRNEQSWAILYLIAMFVEMLDQPFEDTESHKRTESGVPLKRQRMSNHLDELTRYIRSSNAPRKLLALQVMPFLADLGGIHEDGYSAILQDLYDTCSDDNSAIASWALISLGSCAFLKYAMDPAQATIWEQVWWLSSRHATSHSKCRAACHVMRILLAKNIIPYSLVAKGVDDILRTIDLNGPALVADSSLSLWRLILERRSRVPQSSRLHASERLFQWFAAKWRPSDGLDRTGGTFYTHYKQHHTSATEIINFLLSCFGSEPIKVDMMPQQFCGFIGQAFYRVLHLRELQSILLDSHDEETEPEEKYQLSLDNSIRITRSPEIEDLIVDLFDQQLDRIHEKWKAISSANIQQVTEAMMRNLVGFTLVLTIVCSQMTSAADRSEALKEKLGQTLLEDLFTYLRHRDCSQKQLDGLLLSVAEVIPTPASLLTSTDDAATALRGVTGTLIARLSEELEERLRLDAEAGISQDVMDIDDGFDDFTTNVKKPIALAREPIQALCSEDGFRSSITAMLKFCASFLREADREENCVEFMNYLQTLPPPVLIMMRPLVLEFLSTATQFLPDVPTAELFEYLGTELLQGYDIERCETSVGFCVDAIGAIASLWVTDQFKEAHPETEAVCSDMYMHVVKIALLKNITSSAVRISVVNLLRSIIKVNSEFDNDKANENSPVFLLLGRLRDPDVRVSFAVAKKLPAIFSLYAPSAYQKLCSVAEDFLPQERDWREGLALRIYTIAQLAMANTASITRMVFRIFETAQFADGEMYSRRALAMIAKAAGVEGQQDLFVLFSSKLIYVWIQYYEHDEFPYKAFGYPTLKEMCLAVKEELFAQLLARGKDMLADRLAKVVEIPLDELIVQAFPKIVAYGIAFAIWEDRRDKRKDRTRQSEQEPEKEGERARSADIRIRKRLGTDRYHELVKQNFRSIISTFFELMNVEPKHSEELGSASHLSGVNSNLREIIQEGAAGPDVVVDSLMPHFRVKIIFSALTQFLTKGEDGIISPELWTPSMVTFVVRRLFAFMHPAWGSAHAAAIIRNIRVLIALSGATATTGYPLEMLLHGLKRFVLDDMCVEDTVGMLRYLLIKGQPHLSERPTFILGFYLSLLASHRESANSGVTTQQLARFKSVTIATDFHTWLAEYLNKHKFFDEMTDRRADLFSGIVTAASKFGQSGNALPDTNESKLLNLLLEDDSNVTKLLDDVARRAAFDLCGSNFERPETFRNDIFGADYDSKMHSRSLLRICKRMGVNEGFLQWSARVLGRTYAATGNVPDEWTQEMEFHHRTEFSPMEVDRAMDVVPKITILTRLRELLLSNDSAIVGLTEKAFERIIYAETQQIAQVEWTHNIILRRDEYSALQWVDPSSPDLVPETQLPITAFGNVELLAGSSWIKELALAMCANSHDDPVVYNLRPLLHKVDGLAEELFPYITHVLLLDDAHSRRGQRLEISNVFTTCLRNCNDATISHCTHLLECILYLRTQETYEEIAKANSHGQQPTKYDREFWLDINFLEAARAASKCRMFKTALIFTEIYDHVSEGEPVPVDLLLEIFKNLDDPDSYYGVSQESNLTTVLKKFEYEGDGWKSLSHHGANLETLVRLRQNVETEDLGIVDALSTLGMNGLAHSLLQNGAGGSASDETAERMFKSAWKLEQWDLPCIETSKVPSATIYKALQSVNTTADSRTVSVHVDPPFLDVMKKITRGIQTGHDLGESMRTLAMLTEMEEILTSKGEDELRDTEKRLRKRTQWMHTGRYCDVEELIAMRQATFGSLAKQEHLLAVTQSDLKVARFLEAQALVGSCKMARSHKVLQHALSAATQLSRVVHSCSSVGIDINADPYA